jgi:hypothetical protein
MTVMFRRIGVLALTTLLLVPVAATRGGASPSGPLAVPRGATSAAIRGDEVLESAAVGAASGAAAGLAAGFVASLF